MVIFENINIDKAIFENIDINKAILENIDIDIDKDILKNIDNNIDIEKDILENIDIDKILNQLEFGISNRATPSPTILVTTSSTNTSMTTSNLSYS